MVSFVSGIIKKHVHPRIRSFKDFFRFSFFTGSYRGLKFCEYLTVFIHIFRSLLKFGSNLLI